MFFLPENRYAVVRSESNDGTFDVGETLENLIGISPSLAVAQALAEKHNAVIVKGGPGGRLVIVDAAPSVFLQRFPAKIDAPATPVDPVAMANTDVQITISARCAHDSARAGIAKELGKKHRKNEKPNAMAQACGWMTAELANVVEHSIGVTGERYSVETQPRPVLCDTTKTIFKFGETTLWLVPQTSQPRKQAQGGTTWKRDATCTHSSKPSTTRSGITATLPRSGSCAKPSSTGRATRTT